MTGLLKRIKQSALHLDGSLHPDFKAVEETLRELLSRYSGGAAVCVYHHGEPVVDLWDGYSDDEGTPWLKDTMAPKREISRAARLLRRLGVDSDLNSIFDALAPQGISDFGSPETLSVAIPAGNGVFTTRGIPRQAFGHFGFGGSGAWADPTRNLSVAFIVNSGLGTPFVDTRTARISGAALASARARDARDQQRLRLPGP